MYNALNSASLSNESLVNIVHFVIGVLIKYKSVESSEINIDDLFTVPNEKNLELAHQLLEEINADKLINNDVELDKHINKLYGFLKERMEISLNTNNENGIALLNKLRKGNNL